MRRSLKREVSVNLQHAIELCLKQAMQKHNRDTARVGSMIGQNTSNFYKWLGEERIPLSHILAFELACDAHFITQYFAHAHNKMLVDIPTGRKSTHREWSELAGYTQQVLNMLLEADEQKQDPEDTARAITALMQDFSYHRGRMLKQRQPDLLEEDAQ